MGNFFIGLCLILLGFGLFQFSRMFNLYKAQWDENAPPWPYWTMRSTSYFLMGLGILLMAGSLF